MAELESVDRMMDELLRGKKPEEILGEGGLLKELTKRWVERAPAGHALYLRRRPACPSFSGTTPPRSHAAIPRRHQPRFASGLTLGGLPGPESCGKKSRHFGHLLQASELLPERQCQILAVLTQPIAFPGGRAPITLFRHRGPRRAVAVARRCRPGLGAGPHPA